MCQVRDHIACSNASKKGCDLRLARFAAVGFAVDDSGYRPEGDPDLCVVRLVDLDGHFVRILLDVGHYAIDSTDRYDRLGILQ